MSEQELVQKILDYIMTLYKAEYTGSISVTRSDNSYIFRIGVPSYLCPTAISGDFESDDDFLQYIYEELRIRNYMRLYIYKVTKNSYSKEE